MQTEVHWVEQLRFDAVKACRACIDEEHTGSSAILVCANMQCSINQTRMELDRSMAARLLPQHQHHVTHIDLVDASPRAVTTLNARAARPRRVIDVIID